MFLLRRSLLAMALVFLPLEVRPQEANQKPTGKNTSHADSPYVIEQYDLQVRFENDGTGREALHVRSRVQTPEGAQQLSRLAFGYDRSSEQMAINSIVVHKPGGGSIEVLPGAVMDVPVEAVKDAPAYKDAREKTVRVPALKPGDTLEYRVTTTVTQPLAPGEFWFQHSFLRDVLADEESLDVDVPRGRVLRMKTRPGYEPAAQEGAAGTTEEDPARRVYHWRRIREKSSAREDSATKEKTNSSHEQEPPAVQLSTWQSWEDVARWYSGRGETAASADDAVAARAAELTRGQKEDLQKLQALYSFVALKIRTVPLPLSAARYRSLAPGQVLQQGYATPQDKHALLGALAKSIGLSAVPVFVSPTRKLDEDVPSPAQFENVITAVHAGSELVWLDTGPEVAPFRMLSSNLRNKRGFAVFPTSAGTDATSKETFHWLTTPPDPPFPATQSVTVTGELNAAGKLTARVAYTLRGDAELLLRVTFHRAPKDQWNTIGLLLAFSDGFHGEVSEVTPSDPEAAADPFHVEFQLVQDHAVKWAEQKAGLTLPLPGMGLPDLPEHLPADDSGAPALQLGTPLDITTRASIVLPAGVTVRAPFPVAVRRDYAEYRSTYRLEGNRIIATRDLRFLMRELPVARFADYSAFVHAVRNDEAQTAGLERQSPNPPATSPQKHASAAAR